MHKKLTNEDFRSKSGITLTEMLIVLIVSVVFVLAIGSISMITIQANSENNSELRTQADIAYGFKKIQKYVRESSSVSITPPAGSWVSEKVVIVKSSVSLAADAAFGLYQNINSVDFVFLPDETDETVREVIMEVPNPATNFVLTVTPNLKSIDVQLQGEKDNVLFDMTTTVMKRQG